MITKYFQTLSLLLTSTASYAVLLKESLSSTIFIFLVSMALLSINAVAHFNVTQFPKLIDQSQAALNEAVTHFPPSFSAEWNGEVMEYQGVPLNVSYPSSVKHQEYQLPQQLATVQSAAIIPETLQNTQSLFLLTSSEIHMRNRSNQWVSFTWKEMLSDYAPFTVNRDSFLAALPKIESELLETLNVLRTVLSMALPVFILLHRFWEAILNSIMMYFIMRIDSLSLPWKKCFQWALYLLIPAEVIHQIALWVYGELTIPLLSIAFWTLFTVVYFSIRPQIRRLTTN